MLLQEEALITVEASSEELPAIDAAIRGYIQLLRFAVDPSHDRDEVIAQLRAFQDRYAEPFLVWRARHAASLQCDILQKSEEPIVWQVTVVELMAFGTAVIGYLHMLETTHTPAEIRNRMMYHLLSFERRYMDRQASGALSNGS